MLAFVPTIKFLVYIPAHLNVPISYLSRLPALQRNQLVQLDDVGAAEAFTDLFSHIDLAVALLGYSWLLSVGRLRISYFVGSRGKSDFSSAVASGCTN